MSAAGTPGTTRIGHARGALAHSVSRGAWRRAFHLRTADATIAPALRVGLATAVVLVGGGLLGFWELAGFGALGALASAFGRYEPYPRLAGKLALVGVAVIGFVGLGGVLGALGLPMWALVGVLSLSAGVASAYMNGFQLIGPGPVILVFAATGAAGYTTSAVDVGQVTLAAAIGVLVGWVAAMVPALVLPLGPARLAAARALASVASLEHGDGASVDSARSAIWRAREVLVASGRSHLWHGHARDLATLLDAADEAMDDWAAVGDPSVLQEITRHERELRKLKRVSTLGGVGERPSVASELPPSVGVMSAGMARLRSASLRNVAVRVVVASAVAGWVAIAAGVEHPLWASMGAIAALQGLNFTQTLHRGIQRAVGNVGGAIIAVALIAASPGYWQAVIAVVLLQIAAELLVLVNYALTTLVVTPMALVLIGFTSPISPEVAISRVADTVIGVVVGVLVAAVTISRTDRDHLA
ncbi:FUSC family protein [Rhodococcus sp. ABRD24]|uniref:FUSC family protein n=1 Tax=Rhodococcus sp. ABRD24 TaxID=2507582 RepID=UPI001039A1EA|nr:FUSC family protein [Rhodococcus sp. ABRD24]QBJ96715.1 FUSC family protein [Rhodococcus sp. ABRD24]